MDGVRGGEDGGAYDWAADRLLPAVVCSIRLVCLSFLLFCLLLSLFLLFQFLAALFLYGSSKHASFQPPR